MNELQRLGSFLSIKATIVTDKSSSLFQEHARRWSDIDRKIPGAIIVCATEDDCCASVKWAIQNNVPFVPKSGGHSEYSTIGEDGIVIDLSRFQNIEVNNTQESATIQGGVLSKDLSVSLANHGRCTAIGNGNTVGAIPYFLNGGTTNLLPITGYGSDQILSARLITAQGDIIEVDENSRPDLLWAIRGAGQFFGLVTSLTIRTYPISVLGNADGVVWSGAFIFPIERASEVAATMSKLMDNESYSTGGLIMVASPPPAFQQVVMVSAKLLGNPNHADEAFKPLHDLNPMMKKGGAVPIQNLSDALEPVCAKGGFKRFSIIGVTRFRESDFLKTIQIWQELLKKCPDAVTTSFNFEWHSHMPKSAPFDSANSLHSVRFWQNNLIWHSDVANRDIVDEHDKRTLSIMRGEDEESDWIDYPNGVRSGPIQARYRGEERLAKLRSLKRHWDPTGIFTKEFL